MLSKQRFHGDGANRFSLAYQREGDGVREGDGGKIKEERDRKKD